MNDPWRASRIPAVVLFAIVMLSAYTRLNGVLEDGLRYSDCFFYNDRANDWLNGKFTLQDYDGFTFMRPVQFALGAMAQAVFGANDHAIAVSNSLLDIVNLLLVAFLAAHFARSAWAGIAASLFYVGSEKIAMFARTSLGHVPSTLFFLLSFTALTFSKRGSKRWQALAPAISGLALGLGAGIRSEFACFAPGLALAWAFTGASRWSWRRAFGFSAGFFAPFALFAIAFGWKTVYGAIAADRAVRGNRTTVPLGGLVFAILFQGMAQLFSTAFATLWLVALATWKWVAPRVPVKSDLLAWGVLTCIFFALLFDLLIVRRDVTGETTRTLIPMGALICIFVGVWSYRVFTSVFHWASLRWPRAAGACLPVYVLLSGVIGLQSLVTDWPAIRGNHPFPPRQLHDILKDQVSDEARVLIAPITIETGRRYFANRMYLGNKAAYLIDCVKEQIPLRTFVERERIRFVYVMNPASANWRPKFPLGACFGKDPNVPHSRDDEQRGLAEFIAERKGTLIFSTPRFGDVYAL